jgi:hypothetical protein
MSRASWNHRPLFSNWRGVSLACRDRETLLKTFAARLGPELQARAVLIWLAAKG